jgi:hypothetical protein
LLEVAEGNASGLFGMRDPHRRLQVSWHLGNIGDARQPLPFFRFAPE